VAIKAAKAGGNGVSVAKMKMCKSAAAKMAAYGGAIENGGVMKMAGKISVSYGGVSNSRKQRQHGVALSASINIKTISGNNGAGKKKKSVKKAKA
jgi:hypothetical protein